MSEKLIKLVMKRYQRDLQDFEIETAKRIQKVCATAGYEISLITAVMVWEAMSDKYYCAGFMTDDIFPDETIIRHVLEFTVPSTEGSTFTNESKFTPEIIAHLLDLWNAAASSDFQSIQKNGGRYIVDPASHTICEFFDWGKGGQSDTNAAYMAAAAQYFPAALFEIERSHNLNSVIGESGLMSFSMLEDLIYDVQKTACFKESTNPEEKKKSIEAWNAALGEMFRMHRLVRQAEEKSRALAKELEETKEECNSMRSVLEYALKEFGRQALPEGHEDETWEDSFIRMATATLDKRSA